MALLPVLKNLATNAKCLYDLVNYEYSQEENVLREEMRLKRNAWRAILPDHAVAAWSDDYIKKCTVREMRKKLAWCDSVEAYREVLPVVVRSFVLLLQDRSFPGVAYKYPVFTEYLDLMNAVIGKELLPGKLDRDIKRLEEAQHKWMKMQILLEGMTPIERRKICQDLFGEVGRFYLVVRGEVNRYFAGLEDEEDSRFRGQETVCEYARYLVDGFLLQVQFWKEELIRAGGEMTGMDREDKLRVEDILKIEGDLGVLGGGGGEDGERS